MRVSQRILGLFASMVVSTLAACGKTEQAGAPATAPPASKAVAVELTVFAAASLREACADLAPEFEQKNNAKLTFNFGASSALAQQTVAARRGDVFISADQAQMDVVAKADLVAVDTRAVLLSNQLVVVQPKPRAAGVAAVSSADGLAEASILKLSLANPEAVPAGKYAKAWLEKKGLWAKLETRVVPGVDVRAALAAVESGAAQAGIVYATDAAISSSVEVTLRVPVDEGPKIEYPIAMLNCATDKSRARAFVAYLQGTSAEAVFKKRGFIVAPSAHKGVDGIGY
jgi:molybdate transport system substrate-binding protein